MFFLSLIVMSASPSTVLQGETEMLEGAVEREVEVREREVDVARDDADTDGAPLARDALLRRDKLRRDETRGIARRWGRAMTNGMRLAGDQVPVEMS